MADLLNFLTSLGPYHWLGLGLILLAVELLTGTTYILWPAIAAMITGVLIFFLPLAWPLQFLVFALAAVGLTATGHRWARHYFFQRSEAPALNDRAAQMVGAHCVAVADFLHQAGRVRLGDSEWGAQSVDPDASIQAGDRLIITHVMGTDLHVRKVAPEALAGRETSPAPD